MTESAVTATGANLALRPDAAAGRSRVRAKLERDWERATDRPVRSDQLPGLLAAALWLVHAHAGPDGTIKRSKPQIITTIADDAGWSIVGLGKKALKARYGTRLLNYLDQLQRIGWIEDRSFVLAPSGEGEAIVVRRSADVAQLAAATSAHGARRRRAQPVAPPRTPVRPFFEHEAGPPSGKAGAPPSRSQDQQLHARAFAPAGRCDAIDAAAFDDGAAPRSDAPVEWAATRGALAAAVVDGADPFGAALLAFNVALGRSSLPFKWSLRGEQLRRALRRGDRFADFGAGRPGAGFELLLDLLETARADEPGALHDQAERPLTLAWFIVRVDGITRSWRHTARHRAGSCPGSRSRYGADERDPKKSCRSTRRYWAPKTVVAERARDRERWRVKSIAAASMPEAGLE